MYLSDGGFGSSDEILDRGREGLSFFADFIPYYEEAASLAGPGRYRGITFPNDIQRPFDEQRGIDLSAMRADADHLNTAVEQAADHLTALGRYWGTLSGWTGSASEAAKAHHDRFNETAGDFVQKAAPAAGAITGAMANIQGTVSEYADAIFALYSQKCGGMTPQEVRGAIQAAKGNVEDGGDSRYFLAKAFDVGSGFVTFGAGWLMDYFGYGMSDVVRQQLMDAAKQSLRNFVVEFDNKKAAFDGYTRCAQQGIQQDYDTMLSAMRPMSQEAFRDLPDTRQSPDGTTPAAATQQPGGRRHTPPVPAGAQTQPSGTTRPPVGTGSTRPPAVPGGPPATVPSGSIPPVAQQVPGQLPNQPPGQLPSQPLPEPAGQPVTIRNGNSTVTVSPPDAAGRVRLSVSDGSSPPKAYDLDFGRATTASSVTGANGIGGPGPMPPVQPPAGSGGAPMPGAPPVGIPPTSPIGGGPGSPSSGTASPKLPSSLFPWSDKPAQALHPDEDGKLVIRDGDVTITVEPDELADQLKITLDDGHGHQTSYQVDYHDPAHPTLHEAPAAEPHLFGPTGSVPSTPHLAPAGFTAEHAGAHGGGGGGGGGGGFAGAAAAAAASPGGGAGSGQLQAGAYTGGQVAGQPAAQTGAAAAVPQGAGPQRGGAPMGGMPMGGMGAGAKGGEDQERGPNRWLGKEDVFADDPGERRKALKSGGVIGEDKKK